MTAEMTYNKSAIVRKEYVDDGTTSGKSIYQTSDGRWWEESDHPLTNTTSGDPIGRLEGNNIRY
jgi:hypothetical protein